jgi:hypothetical protein
MPSIRHLLSATVVIVAVAVQIAYIFRASLALPPDKTDMLISCVDSAKGGKRPGNFQSQCDVYLGNPCMKNRDCELKRGSVCTKASPCTPCPDFPVFPDPGCELCSITPTMGDCGFVEGYG